MKRRLIAMILMICLVLPLLPTSALAANSVVASGYCGGEGGGTNLTWTLDSNGKLTISGSGRMADGYLSYEAGYGIIHHPGWDAVANQIKSVSIGSFVTYIGKWAFNGCTSLQSVSISSRSSQLQEIGDIAFSGCTSLQSITLPDSLQIIGDSTFSNTGITSITIPASVTQIGVGAFAYCSSLKSINVNSRNSNWCSVDGVLFTKPMGTLWAYPIGNARTSYTVPDGVSGIMMQAFERSRLSSITLPDSLESISSDAFTSCYNLKSIVIPANVKTINNMAFDHCSGLSVYFRGNAPTVTAAGSELRSFPTDTILYYRAGTSGWSSSGTWNGYTLKKWQFTLGRDNNSFVHSPKAEKDGGFVDVEDYDFFPDELLEKLKKGASWWETFKIKKTLRDGWKGSCYGISATIALVYSERLSLKDISTSSAVTYFGLPKPKDDPKLLNSLTYYQLSQRISEKSGAHTYPNTYEALPELLKAIDDCGIAIVDFDIVPPAGYGSYAHAVLATDYVENPDCSYTVSLYDVNSRGKADQNVQNRLIKMRISSDLREFSFADANGSEVSTNTCNWIEIERPDDIYPIKPYEAYETSGGSRAVRAVAYGARSVTVALYIPFNTSGTITSTSGDTLTYGIDGFSGTMEIGDTDVYINGENSEWILTVPYSESFTATCTSDTFGLTIGAEDDYLSVEGSGIQTATFTLGEGITLNEGLTGTYDFTAFVGTDVEVDENETNLIELSATASVETKITYDAAAKQVSATSSAPLQNAAAYSLIRTDVTAIPDLDAAEGVLTVSAEEPTSTDDTFMQILPAIIAAEELPFSDVTAEDWFYDDVAFVYENGLMVGTSAQHFDPNASVTRGMVMTILARKEGIETDRYSPWYAARVEWAAANGISDGSNPESEITREELATMLYRYAKLKGYDLSGTYLTNYTDASSVSGYAVSAVQWAVAAGLMNGSNGKLTPRDTATRAQLAAMLHRFFG